jgi:hypothetical protein
VLRAAGEVNLADAVAVCVAAMQLLMLAVEISSCDKAASCLFVHVQVFTVSLQQQRPECASVCCNPASCGWLLSGEYLAAAAQKHNSILFEVECCRDICSNKSTCKVQAKPWNIQAALQLSLMAKHTFR